MRAPITTHVLDTAAGRPAAGVAVDLDRLCAGSGGGGELPEERAGAAAAWERVARGRTDEDGRCANLLPAGATAEGLYRCGPPAHVPHSMYSERGLPCGASVCADVTQPGQSTDSLRPGPQPLQCSNMCMNSGVTNASCGMGAACSTTSPIGRHAEWHEFGAKVAHPSVLH